jgi:hypothetical protein
MADSYVPRDVHWTWTFHRQGIWQASELEADLHAMLAELHRLIETTDWSDPSSKERLRIAGAYVLGEFDLELVDLKDVP